MAATPTRDLMVLDAPEAAVAALSPVRQRVLAELVHPGSASTVARTLGLPRQKVNYHLRTLEELGLVELVEERARRGLVERVVRATAASYVVSPALLGALEAQPDRTDRLSARYLVALAARLITEVSGLMGEAERAKRPLATLSLDTDIRFASARDRAAFTDELSELVTDLVRRYHDEGARGGRWHRVLVAAHPHPTPPEEEEQ
jgi:DNA-binding transcriptional ArsR family regulator